MQQSIFFGPINILLIIERVFAEVNDNLSTCTAYANSAFRMNTNSLLGSDY